MFEDYDDAIAEHYFAFRPPVHAEILECLFTSGGAFGVGLDIGCGTGYSCSALLKYCERVYGVEPSASMLKRATAYDRVTYLNGSASSLPLGDGLVDAVTFAGSLFYDNTDATHAEARWVCRDGAIVAVYDFEIVLQQMWHQLGLAANEVVSGYDHRANLSNVAGFTELEIGSGGLQLSMTSSELAHVVLSDAKIYRQLVSTVGVRDLFESVESQLSVDNFGTGVEVNIFYAKYKVSK